VSLIFSRLLAMKGRLIALLWVQHRWPVESCSSSDELVALQRIAGGELTAPTRVRSCWPCRQWRFTADTLKRAYSVRSHVRPTLAFGPCRLL
jgi:hypothetical protein